jgi:hypothetical protein
MDLVRDCLFSYERRNRNARCHEKDSQQRNRLRAVENLEDYSATELKCKGNPVSSSSANSNSRHRYFVKKGSHRILHFLIAI